MKIKYIKYTTIICLIAIVFIQCIWLYNSYIFLKGDSITKTSKMLEQAVTEETFSRLQHLPIGTKVKSRTEEDKGRNLPEFTYMQESLDSLNMPISLDSINRIYTTILNGKEFPSKCKISIFKGNQLIQYSGKIKKSIFNIKTLALPLRKDYSLTIQAEISNPSMFFIKKMGALLFSTTILIIIVIGGFFYQKQIIEQFNNIFRVREDFSYAMVHDMKTPLTTIFTALSFLHSGRLDDKPETKEKFFNVAKEEADRLLTLTNKLLTISKLESKKMKMECEKITLEPMLVRLADKFKVKSHKPVSFEFDLQTPEIYADAEYIEEVFSNLIDNSIKYSKERVDIRILSSKNDLYSIIKIYDNGLGISEKDQRSIFNKYERAAAGSRSRRKKASGFGLGLNFVQQVIEAHKGKIFVNSIEGEFTEFIIYLPLMIKEL
jgi:signal transduction histidine kinase